MPTTISATILAAFYAARVAGAAAKFDTILEVVRATRVAHRHPTLVAEAAAGDDSHLF